MTNSLNNWLSEANNSHSPLLTQEELEFISDVDKNYREIFKRLIDNCEPICEKEINENPNVLKLFEDSLTTFFNKDEEGLWEFLQEKPDGTNYINSLPFLENCSASTREFFIEESIKNAKKLSPDVAFTLISYNYEDSEKWNHLIYEILKENLDVQCYEETALACALKQFGFSIAKFLIDKGADLNAVTENNLKPLQHFFTLPQLSWIKLSDHQFRILLDIMVRAGKGDHPYEHLTYVPNSENPPLPVYRAWIPLLAFSVAQGSPNLEVSIRPYIRRLALKLEDPERKQLIKDLLEHNLKPSFFTLLDPTFYNAEFLEEIISTAKSKGINFNENSLLFVCLKLPKCIENPTALTELLKYVDREPSTNSTPFFVYFLKQFPESWDKIGDILGEDKQKAIESRVVLYSLDSTIQLCEQARSKNNQKKILKLIDQALNQKWYNELLKHFNDYLPKSFFEACKIKMSSKSYITKCLTKSCRSSHHVHNGSEDLSEKYLQKIRKEVDNLYKTPDEMEHYNYMRCRDVEVVDDPTIGQIELKQIMLGKRPHYQLYYAIKNNRDAVIFPFINISSVRIYNYLEGLITRDEFLKGTNLIEIGKYMNLLDFCRNEVLNRKKTENRENAAPNS